MDNTRTKTPPVTGREGGGEGFVGRWSRLKAEARERPEKPQAAPGPEDPRAPSPDLPSPETLTFESDYRQFFHPKVDEDVRRTALKKLFGDPHFNAMDGLDVYIDDYTSTEPLPEAMLAGLKQARNILQWAKEDADERRKTDLAAAEPTQTSAPQQAGLENAEPDRAPETIRAPESVQATDGEDGASKSS